MRCYNGKAAKSSVTDKGQPKSVIQEVSQLQVNFVYVISYAEAYFTQKQSSNKMFLAVLKRFLNNLTITAKFKKMAYLEEKREEIKAAKSVSKIFAILKNHWIFMDYSLLETLIDQFGDDRCTNDKMCNYKKDLENFERRTTVKQLQEVMIEQKLPEGYMKMVMTLQKEPSECFLWEVHCLIEDLRNKGQIESHVGLYPNIGVGSVVITLGLPQRAIPLVKQIDVDFWNSHNVESVTVDGKDIFPVSNFTVNRGM